jgi:hypothetical protein
MGAIDKMMTGSGFAEILIESGLCASGSIDQVMSGKHYNRAVRVHHRMLEVIERMLIEAFENYCDKSSNHTVDSHPTKTLALKSVCCRVCR